MSLSGNKAAGKPAFAHGFLRRSKLAGDASTFAEKKLQSALTAPGIRSFLPIRTVSDWY
ncbi:hypothetical protein P6144_11165 [Sphingomonas sp. HITSZ_GF]|uniref:hypothetical protein n=1 Tax=Sphingomonas sp. HITSZ_GF TaxID=3037247 RepID=UPI00240E38DD|nr:hypothetical protein [Sphingomonas sp. HITSZ_GF]MDG2534211.1 hypothetical protein [Sphingomonas sp. HITSZ_GF]